jgi:hypothetical protein
MPSMSHTGTEHPHTAVSQGNEASHRPSATGGHSHPSGWWSSGSPRRSESGRPEKGASHSGKHHSHHSHASKTGSRAVGFTTYIRSKSGSGGGGSMTGVKAKATTLLRPTLP